ncbi:MAG: RimJ/RimL family protein N-acetyltransferase [Flavobacteriales bacterium]|jgi:RimJ/RimL family protein N-acetyltransferase
MNEIQISLQPFNQDDFPRLKSWINTEAELFQFAGPLFSYPLTNNQLKAYLTMKERQPLKVILDDTQEIIGHCEFNFEEEKPVLSRILIGDESKRGNGIGEAIVIEMATHFFADVNIHEVYLYVFEWNKAAIACYQKVGFEVRPELTTYLSVGDERWTRLKMDLNRTRFEHLK